MAKKYEILSYHLNVNEGDCAVYCVLRKGEKESMWNVLVDGGREKIGQQSINHFLDSFEASKRDIEKFNIVIITHWDGDHADGVIGYIKDELIKQVNAYIAKNEANWKVKKLSADKACELVQGAANKGEFQSSILHYEEKGAKKLPKTKIYVPYELAKDSQLVSQLNVPAKSKPHGEAADHKLEFDPFDKNKVTYGSFNVSISIFGKGGSITIDTFVSQPMGGDLLGIDLFTGERVIPVGATFPEPDSPKVVSNYMAKIGWDGPALYCIGCDGFTLCPEARRPGGQDDYGWADSSNKTSLTKMDLTKLVLKKGAGSNNVSVRCVDGTTTGNNLSSIACMIIWASADEAVVSHYIAGDVGEENENLFLHWATVESNKAGVRLPITINAMKLSHHGSKFSTPVLMPFAWKPSKIIVSNSLNAGWNHPSWETLLLFWLYSRWRTHPNGLGVDKSQQKIFLATNYPPYLARFRILQETNTGSLTVGSTASLVGSTGDEFRAIATNLYDKDIYRTWTLDAIALEKDPKARSKKLADLICSDLWNEFSLIPLSKYADHDNGQNWAALKSYGGQLVRFIHLYYYSNRTVGHDVIYGQSLTSIGANSTTWSASLTEHHMAGSGTRELPKRLGRKETTGSAVHENRQRRMPLPSKLCGSKTFDILLKDWPMSEEFKEKEEPLEVPRRLCLPWPEPSLLEKDSAPVPVPAPVPASSPSPDGIYFIQASDVEKVSGFPSYRVKPGHLDWFLGDLDTGALVLAYEPPTEPAEPPEPHSTSQVPMTPLHKTDETSEWLMHCLGTTDDDSECTVSARVVTIATEGPQQLVNITGFELQTKFKYLWSTPSEAPDKSFFFQNPVIFSAEHNIHDFDINGDEWPNIASSGGNAAETGTIVGPAHIVCLSLGETPRIAGERVKLSEVLSMFQIQASEWLNRLIELADLELTLDTSKGQKNALWYTPAEHHETTLRLCFKQAAVKSGEKTVFETVWDLLQQLTGCELKLSQTITTEPRLIVKKTWTLIGETQVETTHEVTVLLQMAITSSSSLNMTVPFDFDTALIFGSDGTTKWVINFNQGGDFQTLIGFIASVFSVSAKDFKKDLAEYLPGCDKISIRRVLFTNTPSQQGPGGTSRSLEVVLQVRFAGMILQCSLQVDFITAADGKTTTTTTKTGFFGKLFPESRTAKLGSHFLWVPYTSGYERWTALEIAPIKNAVGVLEDAPATEVGDLGNAFNALRKKDAQQDGEKEQKELVASPTGLELVGLQFGLTGEEVTFSATVISDQLPKDQKIPAIKLWAASLDLRYDVKKKGVSNCSLSTSMMMKSPDESIPPAKWNLDLAYDGEAALWTLRGGVGGLRGDLLYSLFDEDSNSEMAQLLAHMTLSLQLTYKYDSQAKASDFLVEGNLWLGNLRFGAKYCYPSNGEWTFEASLNPEEKGHGGGDEPKSQSLLGVLESICGPDWMSGLPDMVRDIPVTPPTENRDLTSLRIVRLEKAILMLVRLQVTATTSIAFYQYQAKRRTGGKEEKAPKPKRALVFSLDQLPKVPDIPLVGTMPQPFDEARFLWVGGGDDDAPGWTRKEIEELNKNAQGYPQIIFRETGKKKPQGGDPAAYDEKADNNVVLKSGFHLCLVEGGETRLDYAFGGKSEKDPKKSDGFETSSDDDEAELITPMANTAKVNKTMGPVTILGVGLDFDINEKKLKLIIDGTVKLGPIDLTLLGFSLTFDLKGKTLTNLSSIDVKKDITVDLDGLAVGFEKDPISIAGMFEHRKPNGADLYLGGAVVGFKEWKLEAGGFYGTADKKPTISQGLQVMGKDDFKAFLAYVRVSGPIATIGYAEIRGLVGGFGYNTSIKMPTIDTVQSFPFLAQNPSSSAAEALTDMLGGGWFEPKEGENWVAAGLTVHAFEMLKVTAVVAVEWGSSVRLGIFGLATAEIPKGRRPEEKKFAVVQLGVVAMVDFNAGVMKVDGQLTPASYILDESCHLTGGFGLYTWFGPGTQQGDWVFTIGGYHPQYKKPDSYPRPARLGISWSYDSHINITGGAYFAVTPKTCMGGGSLHVALTLGPLYAYLDAYADFLINYRPFLYRASAGVMVGVNYTLDLWLVTIPIKVDLSATIWLQGPPLSGTVHVDFFVFGFDVKFGPQNLPGNDRISLWDFYHLVIQTTDKGAAQAIGDIDGHGADIQQRTCTDQDAGPALPPAPASQLVSCISGLVPKSSADKNQGPPAAGEKWRVRGAVFAFTVSCKFAIQTATIYTNSIDQGGNIVKEPPTDVTNTAKGEVSARPMHLPGPFAQSYLEISITAPAPPTPSPHPSGIAELQASNPIWDKHELGYSNLPTALYGRYDSKTDPSNPQSDPSAVLDSSNATTHLLTSVTLYAPESIKPEKDIAVFDVASAMGQVANDGQPPTDFPVLEEPHGKWMPDMDEEGRDLEWVKKAWGESGGKQGKVTRAAEFMAGLGLGGWEWEEASKREVKVPEKMVEDMGVWWIEAPGVCERG